MVECRQGLLHIDDTSTKALLINAYSTPWSAHSSPFLMDPTRISEWYWRPRQKHELNYVLDILAKRLEGRKRKRKLGEKAQNGDLSFRHCEQEHGSHVTFI